jgi:hypothetical protein
LFQWQNYKKSTEINRQISSNQMCIEKYNHIRVFSFYDHIFLWIVLDIYTYIKEVLYSYRNFVFSSWSVEFLHICKMLCGCHTVYGACIHMKLWIYESTDWLYTDYNDFNRSVWRFRDNIELKNRHCCQIILNRI